MRLKCGQSSTEGLGHGELARDLTRIKLGLECLDFGILGYRRLLHCAGNLSLRKLDSIALVLLGQFKSLVQLLLERAVANLLQDICVPRLVDLECFAAVRADDFVHGYAYSFVSCYALLAHVLRQHKRHHLRLKCVRGQVGQEAAGPEGGVAHGAS
jgi:hypothetical protein